MNNVKCKKIIAVFLSVILLFTDVFLLHINNSMAEENIEISTEYEDTSDLTDFTDNNTLNDDISEDANDEDNLDEILSEDFNIVASGSYGSEINRQGTKIGVTTYVDGSEYSSFSESLLRFQTTHVYCYDINKKFKETDNYTYYAQRPDVFTQEDQDTIALIVHYFENVVGTLDTRPAVQYYYAQCCVWNYIHSINPSYNKYTTYIQTSECGKSNEQQQEIFNACMAWVNENKENYTSSMQYWINNDGDYQPVLHTNIFPIEKKGDIAIIKTPANSDYTNGNSSYSLQGAVYGVYSSQENAENDTNRITFIITDIYGKGKTGELSYGTYYVKEIAAPKGFVLDNNVYTAVINSTAETAYVYSDEELVYGEIRIVKESANKTLTDGNNNYSLTNAVYGVYTTEENARNNTNRFTTITTDVNGDGFASGLPLRTYYVKEITASKGYSKDEKIYKAEINSTIKITTVKSSEEPFYVSSVVLAAKKDSEEEIYLKDCVFEVKYYAAETDNEISSSTLRKTWYIKTDSEGYARLDKTALTAFNGNISDELYTDSEGASILPFGYITMQEVYAPEGYVINNNLYTYKVKSDMTSVTVKNERVISDTPVKQAFQIMKLADDGTSELKPLANAGFMAWRIDELERDSYGRYVFDKDKAVVLVQNGDKEMFTDENGYALSTELRYGTYIVKETTVPDMYMPVDNFYVTVTKDSRTPQSIRYETDKIKKFYLKITKLDADTNSIILNNSSKYKIWSYDKSDYLSFRTYTGSKYENISEFSTGADGVLILPDYLTCGNYRLDEILAPTGYIIDKPEGIDFIIDENTIYEVYEEGDDTSVIGVVHIEVWDTPIYAKLNINKTGEVREFDEALNEFKSHEEPLSDVEFAVYAEEDIYTYDGTMNILYAEGDWVGTVTTDNDGNACLENIPFGKYIIKEEYAPEDFIKTKDIEIELNMEDVVNEDGITYAYEELNIVNAAYYPKVKTTAVDKATNEHTGVIGRNVTIVDKVDLEDLVVGRTYVVKGKLYDTDTGDEFIDNNGNEVTSELEFTAESESMTVGLEFTFDSTTLGGKTITVFEDLYYNDEKVAAHSDISDISQQIHYPAIITSAKDVLSGSREVSPTDNVTISDTVEISNVDIGDRFAVRGILYDKSTGEGLVISDKVITGYNEVIPEQNNASVEVIFNLDASELAGKDVVCFEYLYLIDSEGKEVLTAEHTDIDYEGQTIKFKPPVPTSFEINPPDDEPPVIVPPDDEPPTTVPPIISTPPAKTGDSSAITVIILMFFLSLSALMSIIIVKKIKKKQ